jgi:hypothetical protein
VFVVVVVIIVIIKNKLENRIDSACWT